VLPEFPLIPASRGFCITLRKTLATIKQVLVKESIMQRPSEWPDNENVTEFSNNTGDQCQETSKSIDSKIAECNENSSSNGSMQDNEKSTLDGNRSIKEATSSCATNSFAATLSETKKSPSSQNTS